MSKRRYVYFQPNKKDLKDKYGDCTIRALSKALNISWIEAFDKQIPLCREAQAPNVFAVPIKIRNEFMKKLGFTYSGVSNKRGSHRPTVDTFTKSHPKGTYILSLAHHVVASVDGKYYDTWDCGDCCLYGYWEKDTKEV